jgi:predicted O-methyltransferase YrrM
MALNLQSVTALKQQLFELPKDLYWQIPLPGAEYLAKLITELRPKIILEIGTSSGYSSICMVEALLKSDNPTAKIFTVESHAGRFDYSNAAFDSVEAKIIVQNFKGHAPEIFEQMSFPSSIDLAFFDGTKSQTTSFLEAIYPLLSPTGIILVDNINSHLQKMQPFLDYLEQNDYIFEVLNIGDGLCQIQKTT